MTSRRICQAVIAIYVLVWLAALSLFAIGTFGLFGQTADPLAGIFLIPVGLPWTLMLEFVGPLAPVLGLLAPVLNLILFIAFCRLWRR
ncbi:hypothetical protein [Litorisediminicola beolgyonensis]|uniref:Uncharacterized protein n=1 Tax=Litorisediminicola beolgyonensis TaxID=1173614 RepID=A0ABW3ZIV7_9RHOB